VNNIHLWLDYSLDVGALPPLAALIKQALQVRLAMTPGVRLDVLYTAGHVRGRAVDIAIEKSRMVRHHQEVGMTAECAARVAHQLSQYLR
jgi:hypothetical protein